MKKILAIITIMSFGVMGVTAQSSKAEMMMSKARTRIGYGDYKGAIADLSKVIDIEPQNQSAYIERGLANQMNGDFRAALIDMDMAVLIDSTNVRALNARGTLLLEMKKPKEAIKDFDNAIKRLPTYGNALINRGRAKIETGDKDGACLDFSNAALYGKKKALEFKKKFCY